MLTISSRGSFRNTNRFFNTMSKTDIFRTLDGYGRRGVAALASSTPVDSGLAASSWDYTIEKTGKSYSIVWTNNDVESGIPVVILIQYGHGTGTGGYVQGRDFINPAIQPIFDQIAKDVWRVVTSA